MSRRGGDSGSARSLLAGAGLLMVGACIGLVLGALLDAPRILLRRLQEPVQTVELEPEGAPSEVAAASAIKEQLAEYRALQRKAPARRPERAAPQPPVPAAPPPAPEPAARTPEPTPEEVIEAIAARQERAAPTAKAAAAKPEPLPTSARVGQDVVQVGAFPAAGSAQRVVDRLRRLGFDAYRSERPGNGGSRHRVRVRPERGGDAPALASALRERGFDVWITRE